MSAGTSCSKRSTVWPAAVEGVEFLKSLLVAQILAKVRFQAGTHCAHLPGRALIVAGGLVIGFWRS
jgi:hypothetical protein